MGKIRPIRFFCSECGKEMWELVNFEDIKSETIEEILNTLLEEIYKTIRRNSYEN